MKKLLEEKLQAYKKEMDYIIKRQKDLIEEGENEFIEIDILVAEESAEAYFEEIQELLKKTLKKLSTL